MRFAALAATSLLLAACAVQPKDDPEIQDVSTVHYLCGDGSKLGVWFEPDTAIVTVDGGETVILQQQRSGSGISYAVDGIEFRGKGDAATWTNGKAPPTECHVVDEAPASAA